MFCCLLEKFIYRMTCTANIQHFCEQNNCARPHGFFVLHIWMPLQRKLVDFTVYMSYSVIFCKLQTSTLISCCHYQWKDSFGSSALGLLTVNHLINLVNRNVSEKCSSAMMKRIQMVSDGMTRLREMKWKCSEIHCLVLEGIFLTKVP